MLPPTVERSVDRYLAQVDQLLPGVVVGFYIMGSVALGAYRERRSDIDFLAVVDGDLEGAELRRLRIQHVRSGLTTATRAFADRRSPLTGACNGVFVRRADLSLPVSRIAPVAAHVGHEFKLGGGGSELNPVGWKVLAERGLPRRGPDPDTLGLDPEPHRLRAWNLDNLDTYWRPWAATMAQAARPWRLRPRWLTAWGVLGAPRLHCTIATGEVVSKEAAGEYAVDVFDSRFHPLIADALAWWRDEPPPRRISPDDRRRQTTQFVVEVADAARNLPATSL